MKEKDFWMWSDNWWIENGKAWLIDGKRNLLFCANLNTREYESVKELPEKGFRVNPRCIKYNDKIFCMPDVGSSIWIYCLNTLQFQEIRISNPGKARIGIGDFWICEDKIYAVSIGLKKIIEVNLNELRIDNYYTICNMPDEEISKSVKVGMEIFIASAVTNHIFRFNIETKDIKTYRVSDLEGGFRTICFDGDKFWLSGWRKEVYVWKKEENKAKIINEFPEGFGIYNIKENEKGILDCETTVYDTPVFLESVSLGDYIWYIPYQTNKIIYINKYSYEVSDFKIMEGNESEFSLAECVMKHMYLLEYVSENRYIGLFSCRDKCIIEIDTIKRKAEREIYLPAYSCLSDMLKIYKRKENIFYELNDINSVFFEMELSDENREKYVNLPDSVGFIIHKKII